MFSPITCKNIRDSKPSAVNINSRAPYQREAAPQAGGGAAVVTYGAACFQALLMCLHNMQSARPQCGTSVMRSTHAGMRGTCVTRTAS